MSTKKDLFLRRIFNNRLYYKLAVKYLGSKCVTCGSQNHLAVHHIDLNPLNVAEENVMLLCRRCHATVHSKWWSITFSDEDRQKVKERITEYLINRTYA